MTAPKFSKVMLPAGDIIAIHKAMEPVLKKEGELFAYAEGWTDKRVFETVAGKINPKANLAHIESLRKRLFGALVAPPPPLTASERIVKLEATISDLSARIEALEARYTDPQAKLPGVIGGAR